MKRAVYTEVRIQENENTVVSYNTYCECGAVYVKEENKRDICQECGETLSKVYIWDDERNNKFEFARYELIWETQSGFEIHNFTDTYELDNKKFERIKSSKPYKLIVDFKNDIYKLVNRRERESEITEAKARRFFESSWIFKNTLKLENNLRFIKTIEGLGILKTYGYGYNNISAARAFDKCFKDKKFARTIQTLVSSGISDDVISELALQRHHSNTRETRTDILNFDETKPHKILNTTKANLKIIKYYSISSKYSEWIECVNRIDQNNLVYIIKMLENELNRGQIRDFFKNINLFVGVIETYRYKPQQLIKYIIRDIKIEQGIESPHEGLVLLNDLNRMCTEMRIKPKEKLSKSLKLHHDIVSMNYTVSIDSIKKEKFISAVESDTYKEKEYINKRLRITIPKEPNDLVREGKDMSHCVASYINSIIDKKCEIYFIRENERLDKSLVTVEVRGKNIVQAKAFANAKPTSDQQEFISLWAKDKNLVESYY